MRQVIYKVWIFIHTFTPNLLIWVSVAQVIRIPRRYSMLPGFAIAQNKLYGLYDNKSKYENWRD